MRRHVVLAVAAVTALTGSLLAACGSDATDGTAATPAASTPVGAGGSSTTPEALQFSAATVGGGSLDLSGYAGSTVAFWFWAPT